MVQLRPYQQDLLQQVQNALGANTQARVMMQLPTGGGKTIIAGVDKHPQSPPILAYGGCLFGLTPCS